MREDDGRKLDHATLETMRIRAVKRIEAGARVEDVATALGLSRSAVFGWMAAYREGGEQALRAKPMPGRPRKLSGAQLRTLYMLIEGSDPRQYQLEFALWTRELVQQLIWAQFRIRLSVVSVGRLLRTLGFSPQRPVFRALVFRSFVDQVPAAAQAARTARVSCGVACSGHGLRNLAAMMTRRSLTAMSS